MPPESLDHPLGAFFASKIARVFVAGGSQKKPVAIGMKKDRHVWPVLIHCY